MELKDAKSIVDIMRIKLEQDPAYNPSQSECNTLALDYGLRNFTVVREAWGRAVREARMQSVQAQTSEPKSIKDIMRVKLEQDPGYNPSQSECNTLALNYGLRNFTVVREAWHAARRELSIG